MSTTPSLNATPPLGSNAGSIQVSQHQKSKDDFVTNSSSKKEILPSVISYDCLAFNIFHLDILTDFSNPLQRRHFKSSSMLQGGGVEGAGSLLTTPLGQGGATPIFLNSSRSSKRHSGHFPDLGTRTFAHFAPVL